MPLLRRVSARVDSAGRLFADHELRTATAVHPMLTTFGLHIVATHREGDREIAEFRRVERAPTRHAEIHDRLRSVRREPAPLPVSTGSVDLATGKVTCSRAGDTARIVVRVHGQPVGTVLLEHPITSTDLVPLAAVAPGLTADDIIEPSPAKTRTFTPPVVYVASDSTSYDELRCLIKTTGPQTWVLFGDQGRADSSSVEPANDELIGDVVMNAIDADADADVVALVGISVPAFAPDNRAGRWALKSALYEPSLADSPATALLRLAGSRYAVIRGSAALRVWPKEPLSANPLLLAVSRLIANGERVRVSPGLTALVPGWRRTDLMLAVIATAREVGRLERVLGRRVVPAVRGRRSRFVESEGTQAIPPEIAVAMAFVRGASRHAQVH